MYEIIKFLVLSLINKIVLKLLKNGTSQVYKITNSPYLEVGYEQFGILLKGTILRHLRQSYQIPRHSNRQTYLQHL